MSTPLQSTAKPYRAYGPWLRERHGGKRVFKVIVDAGLSCPNRDGSKGYGGCAYCNAASFTPTAPRELEDIRDQVTHGIEHARERYGAEKFIIYFQPNSNTHAPVEQLKRLYDEALAVCPQDTVGLAVGTRPDCLDAEKVALLESYASRLAVDLELGMESIHEETLVRINRCCPHSEFRATLDRLAHSTLQLCVHTIFGFPWETREMMLAQAAELNRYAQIRMVKLHHLHVVEGTALAADYRRRPFATFTLEAYTDFLCEFLPLLRPDMVIERLFGVADDKLLIAPRWGLPKAAVLAHIERELARRGVSQGSAVHG